MKAMKTMKAVNVKAMKAAGMKKAGAKLSDPEAKLSDPVAKLSDPDAAEGFDSDVCDKYDGPHDSEDNIDELIATHGVTHVTAVGSSSL